MINSNKDDLKTFIFRTDSSDVIGTGHLMRCLRLATALKVLGYQCVFICRKLKGDQGSLVRNLGFDLIYLYNEKLQNRESVASFEYESWLSVTEFEDAVQTQKILARYSDISLIVDHYSLSADWERFLKPKVSMIIVLDDLQVRNHFCDYFINPSIVNFDEGTFKNKLPVLCKQFLGPQYSLLDPPYAALNDKRPDLQSKKVNVIFISFGGVDRDNWTCRIVKILSKIEFIHYQLEIVVGPGFDSVDCLKKLAAKRGSVKVHVNVGNVHEIMANCDLAIGAGGTMSWERLCLGIPSVILGIAENQYEIVNSLLEKGLCVGVVDAQKESDEYISFLIQYLIKNPSLRKIISNKGMKYVDGKGLQRVVNAITGMPYIFRKATLKDAESIYKWRTDESVVSVSSTKFSSFSFKSHLKWLKLVLSDKDKLLLIAEVNNNAEGVCRFDFVERGAVISIYSVSKYKKTSGLVSSASLWLFKNFSDICFIDAKILNDNKRSRKAFCNAGYRQISSDYRLEAPVEEADTKK